jgi:protein-L-isoaspartate(D-aspartate) O-methyltransferase
MTDFAAARRMMVDGQIRPNDVHDLRIIAAMLEIPRERFVSPSNAEFAYADLDLPVGTDTHSARRLLKPMVLAKMAQAAAVGASDHVLDVGCATGYSSALLARLAQSVVALEEDPALAKLAEQALSDLHTSNVTVITGPAIKGWPARAPYDVIFLNGATEVVPKTLFAQLKAEGRLIAVMGRGPAGRVILYRCVGGNVSGWPVFDAAAALVPGFAEPPTFVF